MGGTKSNRSYRIIGLKRIWDLAKMLVREGFSPAKECAKENTEHNLNKKMNEKKKNKKKKKRKKRLRDSE